jgi:hypothetical protein
MKAFGTDLDCKSLASAQKYWFTHEGSPKKPRSRDYGPRQMQPVNAICSHQIPRWQEQENRSVYARCAVRYESLGPHCWVNESILQEITSCATIVIT